LLREASGGVRMALLASPATRKSMPTKVRRLGAIASFDMPVKRSVWVFW